MAIAYERSFDGDVLVEVPASPAVRSPFRWREVLFGGIGLWVLMLVALVVTKNTALLPAVALIGAGIVPLAITLRNGTRLAGTGMLLDDLLYAFLIGGTLGILLGGVFDAEVERVLGRRGALLLAGVVEEAVKAAALLWVARRVPARSMRSGIYLGAAVGAGFAMMETTFYALSGLLNPHTHETITHLDPIVGQVAATEVFRGLLAPFMHITWTAILGGAIFASVRGGKFRLTVSVIGTYLLVATLHGLWDEGIPFLAHKAARVVDVAHNAGRLSLGNWSAVQTHAADAAFTAIAVQVIGSLLVATVGVLIVRKMTRRARRQEAAAALDVRTA
jgi:RsiW-degrading membrane proteinase PrsW (M82 family)